jgi:IS1 family transposase
MLALRMILEGTSIRSAERLTGVSRQTIIPAMVSAGQKCERFLETTLRRLTVNDVEADELWSYVGCKEKTRQRMGYGEEKGNAWIFVATERTTKLIVTWHVGKRTPEHTWTFATKLFNATYGRFQLSTDAFGAYYQAIHDLFLGIIDYGQIHKTFGTPEGTGPESRYSPGQVVAVRIEPRFGMPDEERICTSHIERMNKSFRMSMRRLTRLTDGHSKKWENHEAAFGLFIAFFNFCRPHTTLTERNHRKTTPAMESSVTTEVWSVERLLAEVERM